MQLKVIVAPKHRSAVLFKMIFQEGVDFIENLFSELKCYQLFLPLSKLTLKNVRNCREFFANILYPFEVRFSAMLPLNYYISFIRD